MHVKTSGIIAGGSFLLSFVVGIIGRAGFPMLFVRAFVFALLSFVLSELIHLVTERFLIDAATAMDGNIQPAGSYVDISVSDDSGVKLSETTEITDGAPAGTVEGAETAKTGAVSVGASNDALSGALPASRLLDQDPKSGYTETMDSGTDSLAAHPPSDEKADLFTNTAMPLKDGTLSDMEESMVDAFVEKREDELFKPHSQKRSGKAAEFVGKNYDPVKLAGAIKTILRQE